MHADSLISPAAPSCLILGILMALTTPVAGDNFQWQLRRQALSEQTGDFVRSTTSAEWPTSRTAVIVCDVWDKHHSLNAVRRLEEFLPRLNDVLTAARNRGALIIHAPSDCMPAYSAHPARIRAIRTPAFPIQPPTVADWCSRIPAEEAAAWPVDQSDGGDDDDPAEHARWAAELVALGRNPGTPWQSQSPAITIDPQQDYISDRGDEVWNILKAHDIQHVVLTGVHTNMCVLGRPFGLRQMVRNGFDVVLMRDLTDCMYNPQRWPYVDHFTGNDLVISHVERFICPTVTSDQVLGGMPFRFSGDRRPTSDVMSVAATPLTESLLKDQWNVVTVPATWEAVTGGRVVSVSGVVWYRAAIVLPPGLRHSQTPWQLTWSPVAPEIDETRDVWLNGTKLTAELPAGLSPGGAAASIIYSMPPAPMADGDAALLVVRIASSADSTHLMNRETAPLLTLNSTAIPLSGRWQVRIGDDPAWHNMPLPAKFGAAPDIILQPLQTP